MASTSSSSYIEEWSSSSSSSSYIEEWSSSSSSSSSYIEEWSSSSDSSSSVSSASSSSSSSLDIITLNVRMVLVNQGHGDIIPFTMIVEKGPTVDLGDGSEIKFTIESRSSSVFKYAKTIDVDGDKGDI